MSKVKKATKKFNQKKLKGTVKHKKRPHHHKHGAAQAGTQGESLWLSQRVSQDWLVGLKRHCCWPLVLAGSYFWQRPLNVSHSS